MNGVGVRISVFKIMHWPISPVSVYSLLRARNSFRSATSYVSQHGKMCGGMLLTQDQMQRAQMWNQRTYATSKPIDNNKLLSTHRIASIRSTQSNIKWWQLKESIRNKMAKNSNTHKFIDAVTFTGCIAKLKSIRFTSYSFIFWLGVDKSTNTMCTKKHVPSFIPSDAGFFHFRSPAPCCYHTTKIANVFVFIFIVRCMCVFFFARLFVCVQCTLPVFSLNIFQRGRRSHRHRYLLLNFICPTWKHPKENRMRAEGKNNIHIHWESEKKQRDAYQQKVKRQGRWNIKSEEKYPSGDRTQSTENRK